jgi:hypothetical protein
MNNKSIPAIGASIPKPKEEQKKKSELEDELDDLLQPKTKPPLGKNNVPSTTQTKKDIKLAGDDLDDLLEDIGPKANNKN